MAVLPGSLALVTVPDGALAVAADVRNNFTSTQSAVNALIALLASGTTGQTLISGGASAATWGNADRGQYGMSAVQSVNSGAATDLTSNWVNNLSVGGVSMSAGVVTLANAGVYQLHAEVVFVANATGNVASLFTVSGTASGAVPLNTIQANSAGFTPVQKLDFIFFASAAATVKITVTQTSGGAMNVQSTRFDIHRLS